MYQSSDNPNLKNGPFIFNLAENDDIEYTPHTSINHNNDRIRANTNSVNSQNDEDAENIQQQNCQNRSDSYFESYVAKNIPVLILITIKLLTQHITGFLSVIACVLASRCANDRVSLFNRRSVRGRVPMQIEAFGVILALLFNQYLLYKVIMREDGGANVLAFKPVVNKNNEILEIFWLILVSQFWIQLVEISFKAIVSSINIPLNRRGHCYSLAQNLLTLYRWLLPVPQICSYLWSTSKQNFDLLDSKIQNNTLTTIPSNTNTFKSAINSASIDHTVFSAIFDIILIIIYTIFKAYGMKNYIINLYKSFQLILKPMKIGDFVNESAILQYKLCPISHLPYNWQNYGERPINITNASGVTNTVSEQGLYCWLSLQGNQTKNNDDVNVKDGFKCPITGEPLRVGAADSIEAKNYLASSDTNYSIFLM